MARNLINAIGGGEGGVEGKDCRRCGQERPDGGECVPVSHFRGTTHVDPSAGSRPINYQRGKVLRREYVNMAANQVLSHTTT